MLQRQKQFFEYAMQIGRRALTMMVCSTFEGADVAHQWCLNWPKAA